MIGDLLEACDEAAEIVRRGRERYDSDKIHRLAAEAVVGRLGDAAQKLWEAFGTQLPTQIPWKDIVGIRIVVDHAYHKIDYDVVWSTLETDVPDLRHAIYKWALDRELLPAFFRERDHGSGS